MASTGYNQEKKTERTNGRMNKRRSERKKRETKNGSEYIECIRYHSSDLLLILFMGAHSYQAFAISSLSLDFIHCSISSLGIVYCNISIIKYGHWRFALGAGEMGWIYWFESHWQRRRYLCLCCRASARATNAWCYLWQLWDWSVFSDLAYMNSYWCERCWCNFHPAMNKRTNNAAAHTMINLDWN